MPREFFRELSDGARRQSLETTMAGAESKDDVWVFGYGSLMWNPCFAYDLRVVATLDDHSRSFCIWTMIARGTPEKPGLGLGLRARKGSCRGILYRLIPKNLERGLAALWNREMLTGIYTPQWVLARTSDGPRRCLTFVVDETHEQFAGEMPVDRMAEIVATAAGKYGTCASYLDETVRALESEGCSDPDLSALLAKVNAFLE